MSAPRTWPCCRAGGVIFRYGRHIGLRHRAGTARISCMQLHLGLSSTWPRAQHGRPRMAPVQGSAGSQKHPGPHLLLTRPCYPSSQHLGRRTLQHMPATPADPDPAEGREPLLPAAPPQQDHEQGEEGHSPRLTLPASDVLLPSASCAEVQYHIRTLYPKACFPCSSGGGGSATSGRPPVRQAFAAFYNLANTILGTGTISLPKASA